MQNAQEKNMIFDNYRQKSGEILLLQKQIIGKDVNEFTVGGLVGQGVSGDVDQSVPICFPAYVDGGSDVVLNVQGGGVVLFCKIRIDFFRDPDGPFLRVHCKLNRICHKKVTLVIGSNPKFPDDRIDFLHSLMFFLSYLFVLFYRQ